MKTPISRRSFIAAVAVAGVAATTPLSAWAVKDSEGGLVAGSFALDTDLHEVTDEEIAALVAELDGLDLPAYEGLLNAQSGMTAQSLAAGGSSVTTYAGDSMYETAIAQAKAAFPNGVSSAVIAGPDQAWIDALSASCLAAHKGPILFSEKNKMNASTSQALKDLGVKSVVIVGGTLAVGSGVESDLKRLGIKVEERLWGEHYYDTQLAIFNYGYNRGYWNKDLIILATGSGFADALSISPVSYAKKAPIFVTATNNDLTSAQKDAWKRAAQQGYGKQVVIVGGPNVVSAAARSFADSMRALANGSGKAEWVWGQTKYNTSAEIAEWAVKNHGFTWNNLAFTTGLKPWDALAGSILQGKDKSVLLLVNSPGEATIATAANHKAAISHVRFFGGTLALPGDVRTAITARLSDRVASESTGLSLSRMLDLEVAASQGYGNYSRSDIDASMNPAHFNYGTADYYQFAVVNGGYSGKVSAAQLNSFIATNGSDGMLAGRGQDFIDAAKSYGTNEVYLLAHAILESGWGKSQLARGTNVNGTTYYNFFGIGAYDSNPLGGGASTAGKNGWNTPRNAILGAAYWIKTNYHSNSYGQNTLYKMRWNYVQAAKESTVWKQYATSRTWATGIAAVMSSCYAHCGLDMSSSGLSFRVPQYS